MSDQIIDEIEKECCYRWSTENPHDNNTETMDDFLLNHLPEEVEIVFVDSTYAELRIDGEDYRADASGDGDCYDHKVEFSKL